MITEVAILHIRKSQSSVFEKAFKIAQPIIASTKGYIEHALQKCLEQEDKYVLIVKWETPEDHTTGFRQHEKYLEWKKLLHHFYDPFPIVEHYKNVF